MSFSLCRLALFWYSPVTQPVFLQLCLSFHFLLEPSINIRGESLWNYQAYSGHAAEKRYPASEVRGRDKRSYTASEVRGRGREEIPHALKPEARGGGKEELPHAGAQGQRPGGATPRCSCAGTGGPRGAIPHWRSGRAVVRRYPSSKVKSIGCALLEQPWRDSPRPR